MFTAPFLKTLNVTRLRNAELRSQSITKEKTFRSAGNLFSINIAHFVMSVNYTTLSSGFIHSKVECQLTTQNVGVSTMLSRIIGPLQDPVTWYKITYTGEQVAQWDFQNKGRCIVLEVPLCNLLTSICNFVPCDRVLQRAYLI